MNSVYKRRNESGQSLLMISLAMTVLLALVALVLDAGNDYVQRRQLNNALDAGSTAGTLKLASPTATNGDVADTVGAYVRKNGSDPARVKAFYLVQDSSGNNIVVKGESETATVESYGRNNLVPKTLTVGGSSYPVMGVAADGDKTFNTYFAGVLGFAQLTVHGTSAAYINKGACSAYNLFPATLNISTFADENGDGIRDVHYEQSEPTFTYRIFEKNAGEQNAPGNFGWLTWNGDPDNGNLITNIQDKDANGTWAVGNLSGKVNVGDNAAGATGSMGTSGVQTSVDYYINNNVPVVIPIFDTVSGTGSNARYHIIAFARFHLVAKDTSGNPKSITGKFQQWVDPTAEGGCTNLGDVSVKTHAPINVTRALIGTLKIQKITNLGRLSNSGGHVPVDVVHVLDISGSMSEVFGPQTKMAAAKAAINAFNLAMQPLQNDQVGLVTFPLVQGGSSYSYSCTQSGSNTSYQFAQVRNALTGDVVAVNTTLNLLTPNGNSPFAAGLLQGRQAVLGVNHRSSNVPIIIFATDGHPNVRLNGQWTGFSGTAVNSPACNSGAEQDALIQANIAKADSNGDDSGDVVIYTVAVSNDFNTGFLQSIATTDTDPSRPHYFRAASTNPLGNIYQQIANQVQSMANECRLIHTEAFAPNATVTIRLPDGSIQTLTTGSTGEFVMNNIQSGTYQVTGATTTVNGVTYNVPTDGLGGAQLSFPISVQVGTASGTYKTEVDLKTTNSFTCSS